MREVLKTNAGVMTIAMIAPPKGMSAARVLATAEIAPIMRVTAIKTPILPLS